MFSALKRLTSKGDAPGGSARPGHQAMAHSLQKKFSRGVQYNMKIIIKGDQNVGKTCLFHRLQGHSFVEDYIPTEEIQVELVECGSEECSVAFGNATLPLGVLCCLRECYVASRSALLPLGVLCCLQECYVASRSALLSPGVPCYLQVACIQWSYKATDDVVKVEVWDVVDRGKKKRRFDGLKLENSQLEMPEEPALDAEFLDVYKGTNGVIIMMDITKSWTFDYVQRELPKVPDHIPVLVLANHCDMAHHRTVTPDHVTYFIESFHRPPGSAQVRYSESSMRNGFGLKLIHKFFNLPFLQLQRETFLAQLETNLQETLLTSQELDLYQEGDDADYDKFLNNMINKRRQVASSTSSVTSLANVGMSAQSFSPSQTSQSSHQLSVLSGQSFAPKMGTEALSGIRRSQSGPIGAGTPIPGSNPALLARVITPEQDQHDTGSNATVGSNAAPNELMLPTIPSHLVDFPTAALVRSDTSSRTTGFMSKIFSKSKDSAEESTEKRQSLVSPEPVLSVEEFVPDGGLLDRSDMETGNPLVAGFQDELDPDDVMLRDHVPGDGSPLGTHRDSISSVEAADVNRMDSLKLLSPQGAESEDAALNGEVSSITADAFDSWLGADSKWRRSPEGDSNGAGRDDEEDEASMSVSVASSNIHLELLEPRQGEAGSGGSSPTTLRDKRREKHRDKTEEKSSKKHKKKSSKDNLKSAPADDKKKKKKKSISGHKTRSDERERDELEEFLNGPGLTPPDAAYEAI
uniref:Rab-like protein 6 n=1 Tax=Timema tahoe TaxID=61484 RepID=A0A7R9NX92_9NEOP|nr:unnamed protein product [Timema tahoe]